MPPSLISTAQSSSEPTWPGLIKDEARLDEKGTMLTRDRGFHPRIELDPKIAWAYFNRGLAVFLGEEDAERRNDFDECLRLETGSERSSSIHELNWRGTCAGSATL